jgi:hypothetical protein
MDRPVRFIVGRGVPRISQETRDERRQPGCLARFARGMLERGDDLAQVQVRVDLWNAMTTEAPVRERFVGAMERRRAVLERWIEDGTRAGELIEIPPKALASLLPALADGLLLHSGLQPTAFRWPRVKQAVDTLLQGISVASREGEELESWLGT